MSFRWDCNSILFPRLIYLYCFNNLVGFKRRGMLVNHLAKRHPDVPYNSVPELNMPIVKVKLVSLLLYLQHFVSNLLYLLIVNRHRKIITVSIVTRSTSRVPNEKHISLKIILVYIKQTFEHCILILTLIFVSLEGKSLPPSNRNKNIPNGITNPTFSATVGSITINPHFCNWCHKQYASKAKLMQHQRKKHPEHIQMSSKSKSDLSFNCNSNSESSVGSLKLDSIASSDKSSMDICQGDSMSLGKSDQNIVSSIQYKTQKLENYLSNSTTGTSNTFIDNFGLHSQYSKGGTYLNGNSIQHHETQYTIDSNDTSLEDLLNITIVGDEPSQNLLISNASSSHTSNIITILGN